MRDDTPTGAAFVYGFSMLFFGGLGAAIGATLWACGLPWHRVLTCGAVGWAVGFGVALLGVWLGNGAGTNQ